MSDLDLLQRYARDNSQEAFATLVERHVNLVYSAAQRQVRCAQLAEDVAQSVFIDLARHAAKLQPHQPLAAWLFLVTRRTAVDFLRREFRRRVREQTAVEIAAMKSPSSTWPQVKDSLDEAMESLTDAERSAVLLRFFENRSLREVGTALGVSEDTAQKRVSRALDRLRALLVRRGVTVSAVGLAADLSAHAIEVAPISLGTTITTAVAASGAATAVIAAKTAQSAATSFVPKFIAAVTAAVVLGVVVHETTVLLRQRTQLAAAPAEAESLRASLRRLAFAQQQAALRLKTAQETRAKADHVAPATDPEVERAISAWLERLGRLRQLAAERAEFAIPELAALTENEWFLAAREAQFDTEAQMRETFRKLHQTSRQALGRAFSRALITHADAHEGRLPDNIRQLAALMSPKLPVATLDRYELQQRGLMSNVPRDEWIIAERLEFARAHDSRVFVGPHGSGTEDLTSVSDREFRLALLAFTAAHAGKLPAAPAQLVSFFVTPPTPSALTAFLARPLGDFAPDALRKRLKQE